MERLKCPLTKRELQKSKLYGGSDWLNWGEYCGPDGIPYCDKGGHRERSIANQPNHLKHKKKSSK